MAIPFPVQDFPMNGKLDMRSDSMDVQPPNLIKLENGQVSAPGRFDKRPGIQAIGTNGYYNAGRAGYYASDAENGTGNLPTDKIPVTFSYKSQIVSIHNSRVMVHSANNTTDAPRYVGRHFPFPIERGQANSAVNRITGGSATTPYPVTGVVQVGNYACYISLSTYLYLNVIDTRDGNHIVQDWKMGSTLPFGSSILPQQLIAPSDTHLAVATVVSPDVVILFLPISSFSTGTPTISNTVTITNITNGSSGGFDLYGTGDNDSYPFHFAYHDSALGKFTIRRYAPDGTAGASWTSPAATSNLNASPSVRTTRIVGTGYYVTMNTQGANTLRLWGVNDSLTADLFAPTTIMASFTAGSTLGESRDVAIGVETFSDGTKGVRVWASGYSVAVQHSNTASDVFNTSTGAQINARNFKILYNKRIFSRAFVMGGFSCVVLIDDPLVSANYELYPRTKSIVAFEAIGASGLDSMPWTVGRYGLCLSGSPLQVLYTYDVYTSGTKTHFASRDQKWIISGTFYYSYDHVYIDTDEANPYAYQATELGDYLYFGGAAPSYFDGERVYELGFDNYPVIRFATATAGGSLPVATLNFTYTYEFTDIYGRIHRSAPATPVAVAPSGGNLTATLYLAPLVTSKHDIIQGKIRVCLYRTTASDASTYYLCQVYTNDTTAVSITAVVSAADSTITSNATLYITGGELDNDVWPSVGSMCAYQNRLVAIDTERNTIRYTKSATDLVPPEISLFNEVPIIAKGMPLTAVSAVDQLLIASAKSATYLTTGQPNNDLGVGGQFQEWQPVSQTLGCTVPRARVQTSEGVWFVSNQGIQLFSGGQLQPVGLPITPYNANTWYGAGVVETHNRKHIMFANYDSTNSVSRLLVYDALNQTWAVWKMGFSPANTFVVTSICQPSGSTVPYYGVYRSGLAPRIATESTTDYRDYNGSTYAVIDMTVRSGWINFGSNQSLMRIRRIITMLDSYLVHPSASAWIVVNIYRDFDDSLYDTASYALTASTATYPKPGQFRTRTSKQKVQTISVEIRVEADTDYYSAAAAISGLTLEVGQRGGAARLPTTKTANV